MILAASLSVHFGCASDVGPAPEETDEARERRIDELIGSLGELPADPAQVVEGPASDEYASGDYQCIRQNLRETRQYDKIVAYSANSESMWPGAIVRGDSVYTGLFTQLVFDRAPLEISISLENLAGGKSMTMPSPSLSNYREAVSQVLDSEITGATPANIYAEIEQVHSQEQLTLAMGASVSWLGSAAGISTSFDFNKEEVRSRYVVKYTQGYYTVDIDQPGRPSDFFADTVTAEDLEPRMGPGNPPVYVSSVTYGRLVVFTFESEYSADELGAALEFVYRGGVDVSGDVSVTYRDIVSRSKINAYILGGSGGEAAQSIESYEALMEFIKTGGNYSKESPGAPIAYKLAYLADNQPARLSFTNDYEVEECERVSQRLRVVLESIYVDNAGGDSGDDLELYGRIWVAGNEQVTLFDRNSDHFVRIRQGEVWPPAGGIAETVIDVSPRAGHDVAFGANLNDSDGVFPDDSIGNENVLAPFESGWRREVNLLLTGDSARVVVKLRITPI
jgi:thiol-activated cytolysin